MTEELSTLAPEAVLASLSPRERRGMNTVIWAMEHWDAASTDGRSFLKSTARRLMAKGLLETMGCYKVNAHDCLTDRWGIGYRLTEGLGRQVARLITEETERQLAVQRAKWATTTNGVEA
jgi:hypothetical protein